MKPQRHLISMHFIQSTSDYSISFPSLELTLICPSLVWMHQNIDLNSNYGRVYDMVLMHGPDLLYLFQTFPYQKVMP